VVVQIIYVVQFLAAFSIFAGIVILASSIAGTRYRRIREVVVLKTLGATRMRIATIFSIEFAVLGLVAGFVGILFANIVVRGLLRAISVPNQTQWAMSFAGLSLTAVLTVGTVPPPGKSVQSLPTIAVSGGLRCQGVGARGAFWGSLRAAFVK
jgi:putative ABC transport system permease protein